MFEGIDQLHTVAVELLRSVRAGCTSVRSSACLSPTREFPTLLEKFGVPPCNEVARRSLEKWCAYTMSPTEVHHAAGNGWRTTNRRRSAAVTLSRISLRRSSLECPSSEENTSVNMQPITAQRAPFDAPMFRSSVRTDMFSRSSHVAHTLRNGTFDESGTSCRASKRSGRGSRRIGIRIGNALIKELIRHGIVQTHRDPGASFAARSGRDGHVMRVPYCARCSFPPWIQPVWKSRPRRPFVRSKATSSG